MILNAVRRALATLAVGACALAGAASHAATVIQASPVGEVAQVRQITLKFSESVVTVGDIAQPDPFSLACEGKVPTGRGRWATDRVWVYDFDETLPPGVRCLLQARPDWKPLNGSLTGTTRYEFNTGGPAVVSIQPYSGQDAAIEEDQHFVLELSGPATPASVTTNARCEIEGLGDRVPVEIVTGGVRDELLAATGVAKARADRHLVLHCARPLPADTPVRLVWGKGIAAAAKTSLVTRVDQRFPFRVRPVLKAEFSCSRERANAPCWPLSDLAVSFTAPVPTELAEKARLVPAEGKPISPDIDRDGGNEVSELRFKGPLPPDMKFRIELPPDLKDIAGRPLANASAFPLEVATGEAPPIAKFATAPFGVLERNAEPMLPVTLRHVQGDLRPGASGGKVRMLRLQTDADILGWYARLRKTHEDWALRGTSLLKTQRNARTTDLPQLVGGDPRPFEVVGIPMDQPGYHVVEIESRRLGESLLDRKAPMYVRTGVLVTNLAVHFKHSNENAVIWVTTLDKARPVEGADVAVADCNGRRLWAGRTDVNGLARIGGPIESPRGNCVSSEGLLVTARLADASGGETDLAFTFSQWTRGIENWRFGLPTGGGREPEAQAHSVLDRMLVRAGETVSMKHFIRTETSAGLANLKPAELPQRVRIVHEGTGQAFVQPLNWQGVRSAASTWNVPSNAKLGVYQVQLERDRTGNRQEASWSTGSFRVEEFRVPLVDARLSGPKGPVVAPKELPVDVQLTYLSGGGMAQSGLRMSSVLQDRYVSFPGHAGFSFEPPREPGTMEEGDGEGEGEGEGPTAEGRLVADKLPVSTDKNGAARVVLKDLPAVSRPADLITELSFSDPNGEVQTATVRTPVWPSAVVVGIKTGSWVSTKGRVNFQVLAVDTAGRPVKSQAVQVRGRWSKQTSTRKRLVGGFYAYDNQTEVKDLGSLCSGKTDERGLLLCEASLNHAGEVQLVAQASDGAGNRSEAAASVWVTRQGEMWFAQDNDDRIDVLPERKFYQPGEVARLQVRMPFREATALVSVEREGVVSTQVVKLRGDDPTVDVRVERGWGPNVYVSVLALRGRVRDVPWYSIFTWGWRNPVEWVRAYWYEGREYEAPTAMVDLSRPAFKLGVASFGVGIAEHELSVTVTPDKPQYAVRQTVNARIRVLQGGKPVQGGEVAFAAVDEGLLALRENTSWDLLGAMMRQRPWHVETSTGQGEVIGKRHYGRKALPAGGDGGRNPTRELFDTLLLWRANVPLDANGEAVVQVPLNDSLTGFRLVAIADAGTAQFGTGSASIKVTQDLQMLAGLPPLVREGDQFTAMLTLRNTTAREMKVRAALNGTANKAVGSQVALQRDPLSFSPQEIVLPAGSAKDVLWGVTVPPDSVSIGWEASVEELGGEKVRDRMKFNQLVSPAVPVRVLQASLMQLDAPVSLPIAPPAGALEAGGVLRGGVEVGLQPSLTGALPGLRRYFEAYPFACLEQKTSKAIGLHDKALWEKVVQDLPGYLDSDGLASYFPARAGDGPRGSDRLTAYLLAATHEAGLPLAPTVRDSMLEGLTAFVEGRIERKFWSPKPDLDVRKLAALEALSRYGRASPRLLGSINLTPNLWPTAAVIDWYALLRRVKDIPSQAKRLEEAEQILRSRLTYAGTTLRFSNEQDDFWWWLMDSADANASRLILAVLDDPAWRDDLPRMVVGSLGRQREGAWLTTTANLWGVLALDKFAARFEGERITGRSSAHTGSAPQVVDWGRQPKGGAVRLPWPAQAGTLSVTHEGAGKPWLTVQSLAAVPLKAPLRAGYSVTRSVSAVEQKVKGTWSRGDVMRVRLEVDAQSDMTWVVVSDPVPGGGTLLGSGLGRDSAIAAGGGASNEVTWPTFEERSFEAYRSYFEYLPRGKHVVEYTVRLNNPGVFALPPTRVEAMYAPETFGELPNAALEVKP
ncbi:alpha-2-macroglobulin family protein [Rhizobacter sp. LjRoot28]|uniref:alpha-2-macroglobulin family protein n=1 Tax=Rhizobacter sp. LjRoot28 TaxID=3342309 RepID=UPI003ECCCDF2